MVRYAGFEHWKAARPSEIVAMGGDGPDYEAYRIALDEHEGVTAKPVSHLPRGVYVQEPAKIPARTQGILRA